MGKYVEQNLNRGEKVVKSAELSPIRLVFAWVWGILGCWLLLIPTIKAIKATIAHVNTELVVTNKRVVGKLGFANSGSLDAPLNKIQSASASTTFGGKIFNYGNVTINTAAGAFRFSGVKNPDGFKGVLMAQIEQYEEDRVKAQAEEMASAMAAAMKNNNAGMGSTIVVNNNQQ